MVYQFVSVKRLEADFDEKLKKREILDRFEQTRQEKEMYETKCRFGMKEKTDGLCYYPKEEDWGWLDWGQIYQDPNYDPDAEPLDDGIVEVKDENKDSGFPYL